MNLPNKHTAQVFKHHQSSLFAQPSQCLPISVSGPSPKLCIRANNSIAEDSASVKHPEVLAPIHHPEDGMDSHGHVIPTEEELAILPRVAGSMPWTAYMLCAVEFAERASYYGCNQVFKNFIRGKLPKGGNGAGAPPRGTQLTAGALGKGTVIASAMTDAFKFLAYAV